MIAFTSDWGYNSYYVGMAKIAIYSISPQSVVIDLLHTITPFNVRETAHIVERVFKYLPKGSVLLSVVDPGVGTERKAIILKINDRYCVGPDNGTFTRILTPDFSCYAIENPKYMYKYPPSDTFHGRDIFAAAAAYVDKGVPIEEFGEKVENLVKLNFEPPYVDDGIVKTEVAYVDGFGNIETTIEEKHLKEARIERHLEINGVKAVFGKNYAQAQGSLIAHFDSSGYLEISLNQGDASKLLNISCCDNLVIKRAE